MPPQVLRQLIRLIRDFEDVVHDFAFLGSKPPEEHKEIRTRRSAAEDVFNPSITAIRYKKE